MRRTILALTALATSISPTAAEEMVVLEPGSKWNVDFDRDKCRLVRFFGSETGRNVLILEQYFPGEYFSMIAAGPAFAKIETPKAGNTVQFLPDGPPNVAEPLIGPMEGYGRSLYFIAIRLAGEDKTKAKESKEPKPPVTLDQALGAQVRFIDIADTDEQVRFNTGPLDRPIKVMNDCLFDLIGSWGLDPEQERAATRRPRFQNEQAVLGKLFSSLPMGRLGDNGIEALRIRLITDAKGGVESCKLIENSDAKLEARTCKGLARTRVEPALDAAGQPMRSYLPITVYVGPVMTNVRSISL